jgi:hypothetical protein
VDWGNGMNINNLMMLGTNPSPQAVPTAYQPNGMLYGGVPTPFQQSDIQSATAQSQVGPSFSGNLNQMPMNRGVARNSPARAYLAAMSAGKLAGINANNRAMMPLNMNYQNQQARMNSQAQQMQFGQQNSGLMMGLLAPFLNQLQQG